MGRVTAGTPSRRRSRPVIPRATRVKLLGDLPTQTRTIIASGGRPLRGRAGRAGHRESRPSTRNRGNRGSQITSARSGGDHLAPSCRLPGLDPTSVRMRRERVVGPGLPGTLSCAELTPSHGKRTSCHAFSKNLYHHRLLFTGGEDDMAREPYVALTTPGRQQPGARPRQAGLTRTAACPAPGRRVGTAPPAWPRTRRPLWAPLSPAPASSNSWGPRQGDRHRPQAASKPLTAVDAR